MASSSGTSSGSTQLQNPGSEDDLQQLMDLRKRKRMKSNRESARRSRMRKQKHLDDLIAQLSQLRRENQQILSGIGITTQHCLKVEAENSVLKAQVAELGHRLQSLNELASLVLNPVSGGFGFGGGELYSFAESGVEFMDNSLSYLHVNQPISASADMIHY